jgi:hypothetical protein
MVQKFATSNSNSLSPKADTIPPKHTSKDEMRFHRSTQPYNCCVCVCNDNDDARVAAGEYHIHKTIVRQSTGKKRDVYAS